MNTEITAMFDHPDPKMPKGTKVNFCQYWKESWTFAGTQVLTDDQKRTYTSWIPQGLGEKWDTYMDKVFERAKKRATNFMDTHIKDLKTEWDSQKKKDEFKVDANDDQKKKDKKKAKEDAHENAISLIEKVQNEWNKVKDWKNPWKDETSENQAPENQQTQETPDDQNPDNLPLENLNINDDSS
jgi:hypothetical protein